MVRTTLSSGGALALLNGLGITEENLLASYAALHDSPSLTVTDRKLLAEVCFLLARFYKRTSAPDDAQSTARRYQQESLDLYKSVNIQTLGDAAPILPTYLPDIMHEGIVKHLFD